MSQVGTLKRSIGWSFEIVQPQCPNFDAVADRIGELSLDQSAKRQRVRKASSATDCQDDEPIAYLNGEPLYLQRYKDDQEQLSRITEEVKTQWAASMQEPKKAAEHNSKRRKQPELEIPTKTRDQQSSGRTDAFALVQDYLKNTQRQRDEAVHEHYHRVMVELLMTQAEFFERQLREYEEKQFQGPTMDYCS